MNILNLPNLSNKPDTRVSYNINGRQYMFRFKWPGTYRLIDIYIIENNVNNYLVKGRALTTLSDIAERIKDESLFKGSLVLVPKYETAPDISQENFHTDYNLLYMDE